MSTILLDFRTNLSMSLALALDPIHNLMRPFLTRATEQTEGNASVVMPLHDEDRMFRTLSLS